MSGRSPSALKPSGYDVVIRNSLAIRGLNRKMRKLPEAERAPLIDEKERLMAEMWASCPHESVIHDPGKEFRPGHKTRPFRFCTSCGFDEGPNGNRYAILKAKRGRTIAKPDRQGIAARLGETLKRTGINI
jgi:hypothetical protein